MVFKKITILDIFVLVIFIFISVWIIYKTYAETLYTPESVVISSPKGNSVYSLNSDREVDITGNLGITHIIIKNKEVMIENSPCKEKTCANRIISKTGESLVCLPNAVIVELESISKKNKGEVIEVSF